MASIISTHINTNTNNNNNNSSLSSSSSSTSTTTTTSTSTTTTTPSASITNGLLSLNLNQQQNLLSNIILVAKFDYKSNEPSELDLKKNERLVLIDNSKNWWLVKKIDNDQTGKKSLLEKIIPRKYHNQINTSSNNTSINNISLNSSDLNQSLNQKQSPQSQTSPALNQTITQNSLSKAVVKHKYVANKPDELTLSIGIKVRVLEKFGDGWWKILVVDENNQSPLIGLYPSNYLQEEPKSTQNTPSSEKQTDNNNIIINQTSPRSNMENSNPNLDSSNPKCESISSSEKEIEYLRVIYPYKSTLNTQTINRTDSIKNTTNSFNNELTVCVNEIVKLIEEDAECLDYDKSWIKVFNSQGITGMIPSKCVEPILDNQLNDFVFIRRPTNVGPLANNSWYFGNITRFETILLFNKFASNGDYLVRDSDNGDYSISLKSDNINNKHFKVFYKDSKYLIGKKIFNTMQELLEHYHKNPIYDQNGEKLYLIKPFEPPKFDSLFLNIK